MSEIFFFKQKTSYEMRISDWRSDVCSSDLYQSIVPTTDPIRGKAAIKAKWEKIKAEYGDQRHEMKGVGSGGGFVFTERVDYTKPGDTWIPIPLVAVFEVNERGKIFAWREYLRSEEHTSELQSLMRISYAVFCL